METNIKEIPKWYFWVSWIGIIAIVIMFAIIMVYGYSRYEAIDLSMNACQICTEQTKDQMKTLIVNLSGYGK